MAEIVVFHHAHGLTAGVVAFADELRRAGHVVHTPDLFRGRTFTTLEEGVAHAREIGFDELIERGSRSVEGLPAGLVYAGFSLGVLPAQKLAQTRTGAGGVLLFHACVPVAEFGSSWPRGVPVRVHAMDGDPIFIGDGDIDAARALVEEADDGELFLYSGSQHLFADGSLRSYDAHAAALLRRRVLGFLSALAANEDDEDRDLTPEEEHAFFQSELERISAVPLDHAGACLGELIDWVLTDDQTPEVRWERADAVMAAVAERFRRELGDRPLQGGDTTATT